LTNFETFGQETLTKTLLPRKQPSIKQGLPVKKETLLTAAFISALLFAVAGTFVSLGQANPYLRDWKKEYDVSPPEGTLPPTILILSPENNTAYSSNNVSLTLNVSMPESNDVSLYISEIYYLASWQYEDRGQLRKIPANQGSINLTDVPEGPRWLEVHAVATGFAYETRHELKGIQYTTYFVGYRITSSSLVEFTIDTTAPSILSLSVENKTYATSDVPLTLTVNEQVSQVTYSLDGQANVTAAGNTTLTGLSGGEHSVTVYATDAAGNTGASKTATFNVNAPEPFPTELVAAAGAVGFVSVSLVVYNVKIKKRMKKL
jgi:hypothetical protein